VVAARLSEDPAAQVVLLEAGGAKRGLWTKVPATAFAASIIASTNWGFVGEPEPALNGRRLQLNQGRVIGGSSSINGMAWLRGHGRDYDHWRQLGCTGWSGDDVLPFFRKAERSDRGASPLHGGDGPVYIKRSNQGLPVGELFLRAMQDAGFPLVDDTNGNAREGFGTMDVNIRRGQRYSAADAYLDPASKRPNLRVIADAQALQILVERGRAVGVRHQKGEVRAAREVILCCGGITTAQLLLLSGIGPADELKALGIRPVLDQPNVGRNLHNHPSLALTYLLKEPISAYRYLSPINAAGVGLRYIAGRRGPLGESYVATGGVFCSDPALEVADAMVIMLPALIKRGTVGARVRDVIDRRHGFTVLTSLARQRSRGRVTLKSADPLQAPAIFHDYYGDPADMPAMVRIVQRVREAMRTPSAATRIAAELSVPAPGNDAAMVESEIRAKGSSFYHYAGTCRMGSDPAAVVDPRLRVNGIDGLRVADASIAPAPLNASMHAPSIMIGEKAAAMIAEDNAMRIAAQRAA
jgi:choline dehydrogenase